MHHQQEIPLSVHFKDKYQLYNFLEILLLHVKSIHTFYTLSRKHNVKCKQRFKYDVHWWSLVRS